MPELHADEASCVADLRDDRREWPAWGLTDPDQAAVDACTKGFTDAKTCDGPPIYACNLYGKGAGVAGAKCSGGIQCSGGACVRTQPGDECGVCAAAVGDGEACNSSDKLCAPGLRCLAGRCGTWIAEKGQACSPESGLSCPIDTRCIGGICTDAAKVGEECPTGSECSVGLACDFLADPKTCVERKVVAIGESCGTGTRNICRASYCDKSTETCTAYLDVDATCTGQDCDPAKDLVCDPNTKKCRNQASAACK